MAAGPTQASAGLTRSTQMKDANPPTWGGLSTRPAEPRCHAGSARRTATLPARATPAATMSPFPTTAGARPPPKGSQPRSQPESRSGSRFGELNRFGIRSSWPRSNAAGSGSPVVRPLHECLRLSAGFACFWQAGGTADHHAALAGRIKGCLPASSWGSAGAPARTCCGASAPTAVMWHRRSKGRS